MELFVPFSEAEVRKLRVGDPVFISGRIHTARDAIHKYLAAGNAPPCDLHNSVIYHCGPIVVQNSDAREVVAAGPTTSAREEPYMADLIERFEIRGIIGKGGMGPRTLEACRQVGCVYMHAVGGAAQVLAQRITRVVNVYLQDRFGSPEAMWELEVKEFPAIVTIDSHGASRHAETMKQAGQRFNELCEQK